LLGGRTFLNCLYTFSASGGLLESGRRMRRQKGFGGNAAATANVGNFQEFLIK